MMSFARLVLRPFALLAFTALTVPAFAGEAGDKLIAQNLRIILESGDYADFTQRFIAELNSDLVIYEGLVNHPENLQSHLVDLLIYKSGQAASVAQYDTALLTGFFRFVKLSVTKPYASRVSQTLAPILKRKIKMAQARQSGFFALPEFLLTLDQRDEMLAEVLKELSSHPENSYAQEFFATAVGSFDPMELYREEEGMALVRAAKKFYPRVWTGNHSQGYLVPFLRRIAYFYRKNNFSSPELKNEVLDLINHFPAREKIMMRELLSQTSQSLYASGDAEYTRSLRLEAFLFTPEVQVPLNDAPEIAFAEHPLSWNADVKSFISERADMLKKGFNAPIGAYLFELAQKNDPAYAAEIAPLFFEKDFLTLFSRPVHTRGDQARLLRIASTFSQYDSPSMFRAKEAIEANLMRAALKNGVPLVADPVFDTLFPENSAIKARYAFIILSGTSVTPRLDNATLQTQLTKSFLPYISSLVQQVRFDFEYQSLIELRSGMMLVDWVQVPSPVRLSLLKSISEMEVFFEQNPGERLRAFSVLAKIIPLELAAKTLTTETLKSSMQKALALFQSGLSPLTAQAPGTIDATLHFFFHPLFASGDDGIRLLNQQFYHFLQFIERAHLQHPEISDLDLSKGISDTKLLLDNLFGSKLCDFDWTGENSFSRN